MVERTATLFFDHVCRNKLQGHLRQRQDYDDYFIRWKSERVELKGGPGGVLYHLRQRDHVVQQGRCVDSCGRELARVSNHHY